MITTDVVILGAGAAGLMCAAHAGRRGRSVIVLERNAAIGEKIRISGGGRCNFTNLNVHAENFVSSNPEFVRSPLARFSSGDFVALVKSHGILFYEKKDGQLFCDRSANEIIALLRDECDAANVAIETGIEIKSIAKTDDRFILVSDDGKNISSQSLVVATGGLSIPKIGATDFGYQIATQFGIAIVEPRPGLVPLVLREHDMQALRGMSGISLKARVSCNGVSFVDSLLITHRGLSGPAILQISNYWRDGEAIIIDLLPDIDFETELLAPQPSGIFIAALVSKYIPLRFAKALCAIFDFEKPLAMYSHKQRKQFSAQLHAWKIIPAGTEGFEKAEVTLGGIDTRELSSKTMETKRVAGLYFIGEVVDVTGWLGGYNFQWAWASGVAAGEAV